MESFEPEAHEEPMPLRERAPDYLATFGVGLGVTIAIGLGIWVISDVALSSAIGYTTILYGVVLMLAGGASGGGYANLGMGAVGSMFGGRRLDDNDDGLEGSPRSSRQMESRERLQKGLRPEANARAFWQVAGGMVYVAIGLAVVIIWS